jgi:predicted ATP-binding protein involved in virulence
MRLSKVSLVNYRCFERLDVELHPRLTVIVGTNGAGKTAVLDGIAAGLTPVLRHLSSANQRLSGEGAGIKDTDFRLVLREGRAKAERWLAADHALINVHTTDGLEWDYWRPSAKGGEPKQKVGEAALASRLKEIGDSLSEGLPRLLPVFAYYGARRGHIEIPERLRATKENYGHPTAALVGSLDSMSDFKEMLKWFDAAEAAELRANKGARPEDFVLSPALEAVRHAVTALLGGAFENPYFNADHRFVVERVDSGAPLQVGQLSQGYQSMLAMGMDFARRLALANPHMDYADNATTQFATKELPELGWTGEHELPSAAPMVAPALMLVDEIDLHLHPTWQQRVLDDLMRTFPGTQFIVTTHSPQVLSTVSRDHIRVLTQREDGQHAALKPDFSPLGHEAGDALAKVMGTHKYPPLSLQEDIRAFEKLIRAGMETSPEAADLRATLDKAGYQIHESDLVTWRFLANRKPTAQS